MDIPPHCFCIANGLRKTGQSSIISMYGPPSPLSEPESMDEVAQRGPNQADNPNAKAPTSPRSSPPPIISSPRPSPFSPSIRSPPMLSSVSPHASNTGTVNEALPALPHPSSSSLPINNGDVLESSARPFLYPSGTGSGISAKRRKNNHRNSVHKQEVRNRKPTLCTPGDGKIFCCPCWHKKKQCTRILDGKGLLDHLCVFLSMKPTALRLPLALMQESGQPQGRIQWHIHGQSECDQPEQG